MSETAAHDHSPEDRHSDSSFPVTLTAVAVERFREAMRREGLGADHGLRVGVTPGGCSGLSYSMSFESAPRPGDRVGAQDGLTIYVSEESARHLEGVTIDYVESLSSSGFRFVNPNAERTCGCGTSFS